jgi:hypothetical protein
VVLAARELIARHGGDSLGKVAKLHFRTTAAVMGQAADESASAADQDT